KAHMYLTDLPTIENGGAVINDVEVKEGDSVVDVNGDVVDLAAGVTVKAPDGSEVEFSGSPLQMQQMVITFQLEDGITWSDGEPLKAADMELASSIDCDPESGATAFTVCERTASEDFADTSYTRTLLPGYTPPLYFTLVPNWYPSHQVLSDGRVLADVPASEWTTLPEISESP